MTRPHNLKLRINPTGFADRRTLEQLRHSDSIVEKRWRWRVVENEKRRAAKL